MQVLLDSSCMADDQEWAAAKAADKQGLTKHVGDW